MASDGVAFATDRRRGAGACGNTTRAGASAHTGAGQNGGTASSGLFRRVGSRAIGTRVF